MLGFECISMRSIPAGHIVTRRDHFCGDFVDSDGVSEEIINDK